MTKIKRYLLEVLGIIYVVKALDYYRGTVGKLSPLIAAAEFPKRVAIRVGAALACLTWPLAYLYLLIVVQPKRRKAMHKFLDEFDEFVENGWPMAGEWDEEWPEWEDGLSEEDALTWNSAWEGITILGGDDSE